MEINYMQIAAAIAAYLAPFTPYLVESGKAYSGKAGEAAWMKTQEIWGRIKSRFGDDSKIKEATLLVSANPEDKNAQSILAIALAERLKEDPDLVRELSKMMGGQKAVQEVIVDDRSVVKDVIQEMKGQGTQTIRASDDSTISEIRQIKNNSCDGV